MTATIKPIQTRYKGFHFRSRLEARWAVFFDAMGLQWEYEPEGFDLDGVNYLPDFRVQTGDLTYWYEVKPRDVVDDRKFQRFHDLITADPEGGNKFGVEARLLSGDPTDVFSGTRPCPRCGLHISDCDSFSDGGELGFLCYDCDMVTACGGGNPLEIGWAGISFHPYKGWIMASRADYRRLMTKVTFACFAARSARFEHGECGAT
jgi:hypothetical protein